MAYGIVLENVTLSPETTPVLNLTLTKDGITNSYEMTYSANAHVWIHLNNGQPDVMLGMHNDVTAIRLLSWTSENVGDEYTINLSGGEEPTQSFQSASELTYHRITTIYDGEGEVPEGESYLALSNYVDISTIETSLTLTIDDATVVLQKYQDPDLWKWDNGNDFAVLYVNKGEYDEPQIWIETSVVNLISGSTYSVKIEADIPNAEFKKAVDLSLPLSKVANIYYGSDTHWHCTKKYSELSNYAINPYIVYTAESDGAVMNAYATQFDNDNNCIAVRCLSFDLTTVYEFKIMSDDSITETTLSTNIQIGGIV